MAGKKKDPLVHELANKSMDLACNFALKICQSSLIVRSLVSFTPGSLSAPNKFWFLAWAGIILDFIMAVFYLLTSDLGAAKFVCWGWPVKADDQKTPVGAIFLAD